MKRFRNYRLVKAAAVSTPATGISLIASQFGAGKAPATAVYENLFSVLKMDKAFIHALAKRASFTPFIQTVIDNFSAYAPQIIICGVDDNALLEKVSSLSGAQLQGSLFPVVKAERLSDPSIRTSRSPRLHSSNLSSVFSVTPTVDYALSLNAMRVAHRCAPSGVSMQFINSWQQTLPGFYTALDQRRLPAGGCYHNAALAQEMGRMPRCLLAKATACGMAQRYFPACRWRRSTAGTSLACGPVNGRRTRSAAGRTATGRRPQT